MRAVVDFPSLLRGSLGSRRCLSPLFAGLLAGCSLVESGADGGVAQDAESAVDAPPARVVDSGSEAGTGDAEVPEDAAFVDASTCACEAATVCEMAECRGGLCIREPVADGTSCDVTDQICVAGACVPRGCGDGYREPGPTPAREACDDGNTADDDGCTAACEPQRATLEARADGRDHPVGPAASIGIDGAGRVLIVWNAEIPGGVELRARRLSAGGALIDTDSSILLTSTFYEIPASVAGLRGGGWVVAWSAPLADGDMEGVAFRQVAVDGSLGATTVASEEIFLDQSNPSVTALEDGFAIAWNDQSQLIGTGPALRTRARRFAADGRPSSREFSLSAGDTQSHQDPVLAAVGTTLVAAWVAQGSPTASIRARRFAASGPLDSADLVIAAASASQPAIAALASGGEVAIVWRDTATDPYGDLLARRLSTTDGSMTAAQAVTASPEPYEPRSADIAPSVAPLGDGFLVVHQRYRNERGLGLVLVDVDPPPPELEALRALLADTTAGHGAVASGPRGVWALWSTGTDPSGVDAYRSVVGYLMASD